MNSTKILEILSDWNYWDKALPPFIQRESYANVIDNYSQSEEIIVLKGIRRGGKSTLLLNHIHNLTQSSSAKSILFVNFEDPRFSNELNLDLLDDIFDIFKEQIAEGEKPSVFLDEIQLIPQWEKWVRTKHELKQANLYVTGSSSKLLSKEFGTALSGRFLDINIFPLSFHEYLTFKNYKITNVLEITSNRIQLKKLFNQYTKEGGFPKVVLLEDSLKQKELDMYFDTILLKDIVARYNLKSYDNIKRLALYLISNTGAIINLNKLKKALNISYELLSRYYEYIKDTYMLFEISQYNYSLKKQMVHPRKVYCIDPGIINAVSFQFFENKGQLLENIVFIELIRRGYAVNYHLGKRECDFLAIKGQNIEAAIQVTYIMDDPKTRKREVEGLIEAMNTYNIAQGYILTYEEESTIVEEGHQIKVVPIWKWLLLQ